MFLQISQNSQDNTCTRVSFLIKLQAGNFIKKETLEISKNTFFTENIQAAASVRYPTIQLADNNLDYDFRTTNSNFAEN